MHRKILVIDETTAFVGGVNVGKKYSHWRDLQIEVTGQIVATVLRSFARSYRKSGGKKELLEADSITSKKTGRIKKVRRAIKKARLWFLDHGIGKRRHLLRKYFEERLDYAEKSIVFVTPYLFPPRWFIARLHQALLRGVEVEIILPASTDHWIVNGISRSYASCLSQFGARCYFSGGMNHAKAMIVDGKEGIIGSQNIDLFSLDWNIEAGVFFHEPDILRDLSIIIERWKKEAKPFDPSLWSSFHWYDVPVAFFLRLFGFLPLE